MRICFMVKNTLINYYAIHNSYEDINVQRPLAIKTSDVGNIRLKVTTLKSPFWPVLCYIPVLCMNICVNYMQYDVCL